MPDFFVDDSVVGGGDDGTDWDTNAFNTGGNRGIKTALESAGYAPGDKIWIRRTTVYDEAIAAQNADIAPTDDGTAAAPLEFIGWPRAAIPNTIITAADWTNGSTMVDNVVGITPTRESHQARYVTAPDGFQYLITAILWEITVDGMGAGDEFTVGSQLNHTVNTRKGKIYTFVDNLDTTGTLQAVLDAEQTWDNTDNITDADGGDAELDANATAVGFVIDREYAGATVTGVDGKFQVEADEDYATRPDVGALRATWDTDAIALPIIDFNNEAYNLAIVGDRFYILRNIEFKDSAVSSGIIAVTSGSQNWIIGCLFKQNSNASCLRSVGSTVMVKRFTGEGSHVGASQEFDLSSEQLNFIDGAVYNMGGNGISSSNYMELNNMNIGVEIANGDDDMYFNQRGFLFCKDVKLHGSNGFVELANPFASPAFTCSLMIENYGKVLGEHRMFYPGGIAQRAAVSGETPNKKLSDYVLKITPNVDYAYKYEEGQCVLFEHEYQLNSGANTIKYWLYNDTGATLNNGDAVADIYLVAEYVDSYGDVTSEYTITKAYSTEATIADAADADDWDSLSATMILAIASKVRVRLRISYYDVVGDIIIDPKSVLS